jgi:hypothetical protein
MIETQGLAILYGWLIFGGLLCVLAFVVLRSHADRSGSTADQPRNSADSATETTHADRT